MDGQSRQLGYAVDSQFYQTDDFADYVREGLNNLTLDDVNRVIRENLSTENIQYVFVTKDAEDLRERLTTEQASPMTYDAVKPQELLDEDAVVAESTLGFAPDKVTIVGAESVFN